MAVLLSKEFKTKGVDEKVRIAKLEFEESPLNEDGMMKITGDNRSRRFVSCVSVSVPEASRVFVVVDKDYQKPWMKITHSDENVDFFFGEEVCDEVDVFVEASGPRNISGTQAEAEFIQQHGIPEGRRKGYVCIVGNAPCGCKVSQ